MATSSSSHVLFSSHHQQQRRHKNALPLPFKQLSLEDLALHTGFPSFLLLPLVIKNGFLW